MILLIIIFLGVIMLFLITRNSGGVKVKPKAKQARPTPRPAPQSPPKDEPEEKIRSTFKFKF